MRSLLHIGVSPLAFGAYENSKILCLLLDARIDDTLTDANGHTAADLAAEQQSGTLLSVLEERGAATRSSVTPMATDAAAPPWPEAVDLDADSALTLASRDAVADSAELVIPVDKNFAAPSANAQTSVARGTDGEPLDLMMTKVDLQKGWYGQNVFYRMQVLHEANQDNYILFTRWGRIGDMGQFQTSPCESLAKAESEFCKIVQSKTGNNWYASKKAFTKKTLKYQIHPIKYVGKDKKRAADVLRVDKWTWPTPTVVPSALARLLTVSCDPKLLNHALSQQQVASAPSSLELASVEEARTLLATIGKLLCDQVKAQATSAAEAGTELQRIADEIAAASSRLYELVPTNNFSHINVKPLTDQGDLARWTSRVADLHEIAVAAKLLLGAQAQNDQIAPPDYLYRACNIRLTELSHDAAELALLEQYINRSAPGSCQLSTAVGASADARVGEGQPKTTWWQAVCDVQCFEDAECSKPASQIICCGSTFKQLTPGVEGLPASICVREKPSALWARPTKADGSTALCKLGAHEALSSIASIHRVEHADDAAWRKAYTDDPSEPPSTMLFHGSSLANALSILKSGLQIRPSAAATHQGSRFGDGVYLANAFAKSRSYCQLHDGVGVMFLCEAHTGPLLETRQSHSLTQVIADHLMKKKRRALGLKAEEPLPADAQKELRLVQAAVHTGLESVDGVESLRYVSAFGPEPSARVIHPNGSVVPCGPLVPQPATAAGGRAMNVTGDVASDEIILYDARRVRVRYVLELREKVLTFKEVKKADNAADGAQAEDDEEEEEAPMEEEEVEDEDEDDEEDEEDMDDDE